MRALEIHLRRSLKRLLKLQEDITGVGPEAVMVGVANFLNNDGLQIVIENLQTAEIIADQNKSDHGGNHDHLINPKRDDI